MTYEDDINEVAEALAKVGKKSLTSESSITFHRLLYLQKTRKMLNSLNEEIDEIGFNSLIVLHERMLAEIKAIADDRIKKFLDVMKEMSDELERSYGMYNEIESHSVFYKAR